MELSQKIKETVSFIESSGFQSASSALVLGTGMGEMEDLLTEKIEILYSNLPHFPVSTVKSHAGKLIFGKIGGTSIILVSGRFHYYEGYSLKEATYYIHVLKALGVTDIFFTNASGGLNPHFKAGDIVLVTDHINLFPDNPLRGINDESQGPRFPDMLSTYNKKTIAELVELCKSLGIKIQKGVYLGWQGPSLETPAEYKMARILGADLIGMSTTPEVIVAKYYNMNICVLSIVSNQCYPISTITETTIDQVIAVVKASSGQINLLLSEYFKNR